MSPEKRARHAAIVAEHGAGHSIEALARRYALPVARIEKIVRKAAEATTVPSVETAILGKKSKEAGFDARPLSDLIHAHAGRPGVALGGGESLPEDMARVPAGAVLVSANQHGCLFTKCDYIVAADSTEEQKTWLVDGKRVGLRDHGAPIISMRRNIADFRIFKPPVNNSGVLAAWVLWVMGCSPILLAGMSCYQGATYHHNPKAQSSGKSQPLSSHLTKWRQLVQHVPGAMIRAMSGPLALHKVFPAYDPNETPSAPAPYDAIFERVKGARVRVVSEWRLPPYRYRPGDVIEVNYGELSRGMREKKIQRVGV